MHGDHITAYLTSCRADGLAKRTIAWHEYNLSLMVRFAGGRSITITLLREFIDDMHQRKLSAYTIRGRIRSLKKFFHWCVDEELLVDDPSQRLKLPRAPHRIPRGISLEDFGKLFANARSARDRAVLMTLLDTGCRASELCGMRLSDLNLETGIVLVCGKGNQEGFVSLSSLTCETIAKWLEERNSKTDSLFTTITGEKFTYHTLKEILRRLKRTTGVKGQCNPHSFRHGFAREYLMNGGDPLC